MASRQCVKNPNNFCYICGLFTLDKKKVAINKQCSDLYEVYFKKPISHQDKSWVPHIACSSCIAALRRWNIARIQVTSMPFKEPMVWREPVTHDDCYFCQTQTFGFNTKNSHLIEYPKVTSVTKSIPYGAGDTPPAPSLLKQKIEDDVVNDNFDPIYDEVSDSNTILFNQAALNDLIRDLGLPKDKSELLGSRLKERNLLASGTTFFWYRHREQSLVKFFSEGDGYAFCSYIDCLMKKLGLIYNSAEWRLILDSSKRSFKAVQLHNTNIYASISITHSRVLNESYDNVKTILNAIGYERHGWKVCGDLKIISMLLGQQSGYTKYPCFICLWDSRDRKQHYVRKYWPLRDSLKAGDPNILKNPLIDSKKILLPPLHIKLGLMKQFVKALDKNSVCFKYLVDEFPTLTQAKITEGVFVGPQNARTNGNYRLRKYHDPR